MPCVHVSKFLPSNVNWSDVPGWRKTVMVVWATLECLLLAGLFFGWYSLVYVLKDEGIYGYLCTNVTSNGSVITPDVDKLTFVTLQNSRAFNETGDTGYNHKMPPVDQTSIEYTSRPSLTNQTAGYSSADTTDHGCWQQDERLALVFTIGCFGVTLGVPLIGFVQDRFGLRVARVLSIIVYFTAAQCLANASLYAPWLAFIGMILLATGGLPILITNIQVSNMFSSYAAVVIGILSGSFDASASAQIIVKVLYEHGVSRHASFTFISFFFVVLVGTSTFLFLPKRHIPKPRETIKTNEPNDDCEVPVPRMKACLLSGVYIMHVVWLSILQLRVYYYISSFNSWIEYATHGDEKAVSLFTNASLYAQYGGIVAALLIGLILDKEKKRHKDRPFYLDKVVRPAVWPLVVTTTISALMSILMLSKEPVVLYIVFVLFTAFRSFLYGLGAAYVQMIFPPQYFGSLYGVMMIAAGLVTLLQYAFVVWLDAHPRGPFKVNLVLAILVLFAYSHPAYIWWLCRKNRVRMNDESQGHLFVVYADGDGDDDDKKTRT